jgi:hypothetical protein
MRVRSWRVVVVRAAAARVAAAAAQHLHEGAVWRRVAAAAVQRVVDVRGAAARRGARVARRARVMRSAVRDAEEVAVGRVARQRASLRRLRVGHHLAAVQQQRRVRREGRCGVHAAPGRGAVRRRQRAHGAHGAQRVRVRARGREQQRRHGLRVRARAWQTK